MGETLRAQSISALKLGGSFCVYACDFSGVRPGCFFPILKCLEILRTLRLDVLISRNRLKACQVCKKPGWVVWAE